MQRIDFYFGLGSRYSYLAFTQISRIERAAGACFVLHPISSVELLAQREASPFDGAPISGQYDWDYRRRDAELWADYYGVPYREPAALPDDHRLMARACHAAARQDQLGDYCAAMFGAVFVEGRRIDNGACIALASRLGMDATRFTRDFDSTAVDRRVTQLACEARRRGAFGVPTFFVGAAMFWGNDRLALLEHHLRRQPSLSKEDRA